MNLARIEELIKSLLIEIGENPNRGGLKNTPSRVARMYQEMLYGYEENNTYSEAIFFDEVFDDFILIKNIDFSSFCEHHILPFFGTVHIAYIAKKSKGVLGISKLARIVNDCSSKLQIQERLVHEIVEKLNATIENEGIAISVEGVHTCMSLRGVKQRNAVTITTKFTGKFLKNDNLKTQFINLIKG